MTIKDLLQRNRDKHNGKALTEKIREVNNMIKEFADELENTQDPDKRIAIKEQIEILRNYEVKSINKDKWNKFYINWKALLYLNTLGMAVAASLLVLHTTGALIIEGMIKDMIIGYLSAGLSMLAIVFTTLGVYLGIKRKEE